MSEYRFLYWDDYEPAEGDKTGKTSSTANTPEDDSKGSRKPKGV